MPWYDHVLNVLDAYFRWPYGGVWGNVWAIVPCGLVTVITAWFGRHRIGRALVRWWHKHWIAHLKEIEDKKKRDLNDIQSA